MPRTTALLNFILDSKSWVLKTKESAEKFSSAVVLGLELNLQLFFLLRQKRAKNHRLLNFILYSESWVLKTKESAEKFSSAVVLGLELNLQLFFPIKAKTCQEPPRC